MASCELDYRLPQKNDNIKDDFNNDGDHEDDSEEESQLRIVESPQPVALFRSLSAGDEKGNILSQDTLQLLTNGHREREQHSSGSSSTSGDMNNFFTNNSDAVESLLLLGQGPVFSQDSTSTIPNFTDKTKYSNNPMEQKLMVNYYQKMRERNNEASKRCRLKRRIKQDSLEKTKMLLESTRDALGHRVAKLHKIKQILDDACRCIGKKDRNCDCQSFTNLIKTTTREMPDMLDLSNSKLIRKSKLVRETNMEEILGEQAASQLNDLRPLKRGPRKQQDERLDISDTPGLILGPECLSAKPASPVTALDLSTSSGGRKLSGQVVISLPKSCDNGGIPNQTSDGITHQNVASNLHHKTENESEPAAQNKERKFAPITFLPKTYVPLAPKQATTSTLPTRKIIVDNPHHTLTVPAPKTTITSFPSNTIILTPLGSPGIPGTIFNLSGPPIGQPAKTCTNEMVSIKSEPDISIVEIDTVLETTGDTLVVKEEKEKVDLLTCCGVKLGDATPCSKDLIDLNSLTQTLDLVTMEPKMAGELTAAEKYIIKSRLSMEFWKANETSSFICSVHRNKIVHESNLQACSVCSKKRSKKLEMYFITYRMAVEFYMTNGRFLSIGLLACSGCKLKTLKGLDFGNSYIVPDSGEHPLDDKVKAVKVEPEEVAQELVKKELDDSNDTEEHNRGVKREFEDDKTQVSKRLSSSSSSSVHREVVLPPTNTSQGKLATIQPLPPRPQVARVLGQQTGSGQARTGSVGQPGCGQTRSESGPDMVLANHKYQRLNEALLAFNPQYKPLGFTINSGKLSTCSPGVLTDALRATQEAVSTILSTIAPGQEESLWNYIKPEMDLKYKSKTEYDHQM